VSSFWFFLISRCTDEAILQVSLGLHYRKALRSAMSLEELETSRSRLRKLVLRITLSCKIKNRLLILRRFRLVRSVPVCLPSILKTYRHVVLGRPRTTTLQGACQASLSRFFQSSTYEGSSCLSHSNGAVSISSLARLLRSHTEMTPVVPAGMDLMMNRSFKFFRISQRRLHLCQNWSSSSQPTTV
jgi:hypothetical protein